MKFPKLYPVVTFLTSSVSFNHLVMKDQDRVKRTDLYQDQTMHFNKWQRIHEKEIGDILPSFGHPDDGNGRFQIN